MRKEIITNKEAICLLVIFYFGSSFLLGISNEAKNDGWISGIFGLIFVTPMIFAYIRVLFLFPGKDLYEIFDLTFGKAVGKIFSVLYIWYSFHLGALVIRNFGEFVNTVAMPETPMFVSMLCLTFVSITSVKSGVEVLARTSTYLLPLLLFITMSVQLMGFPLLDFRKIKPFFGNGLPVVLKGGAVAFSFPFAESVLFLAVFSSLKGKESIKKVYLIGTIIGGLLIILTTLRNILILGGIQAKFYFPSHVAVSRISIGDFLQRIELTVALVFVVSVFVKTSVCLLVACKGIAHLFLLDYRSIVIQMGLIMLYFSYSLYDSIMEMAHWAFTTYFYYAFPFQVIFPVVLLITAEIKVRRRKKTAAFI